MVRIRLVTFLLTAAAAAAQAPTPTPTCYTLESLEGSFAVIGSYGSNLAIALGIRYHDAYGKFKSTFINNQPATGSTTGARMLVNGINAGTYAINCDGSGVVTRVATLADGTTIPAFDDFVVTKGEMRNGKLIANEIVDAQRIPSGSVPGGVFLSRKYTRRPNPQSGTCYTLESLQGNFASVGFYGQNIALAAQPELLDGQGNLTRTGFINQPDTTSTTGGRTVGKVTSTGTYTVTCEGRGTINRVVTRPDGTKAIAVDDFLITEGSEQDGKFFATTFVDAQRDPSVILPGGVFLTRVHTRRPEQPVITGPDAEKPKTIAIAGPKNVTETAKSVQLDGTASTSADGKPLKFEWTMAPGSPIAAILGGDTATPMVQFAQGRGIYTFQLTVTDSTGTTATDFVTIDYRGI